MTILIMKIFRAYSPKVISMTEREIILLKLREAAELAKQICKAILIFNTEYTKQEKSCNYLGMTDAFAEIVRAIKDNPQKEVSESSVIDFLNNRYRDEFPMIVHVYLKDPAEITRSKALKDDHFRKKTRPVKKRPVGVRVLDTYPQDGHIPPIQTTKIKDPYEPRNHPGAE